MIPLIINTSYLGSFPKYISDAFEEQHQKLIKDAASGADPEDRDEYKAVNVFWVPKVARWAHIQQNAKQAQIGQFVDDAMRAIETENSSLKGVLPKDYSRPSLNQQRLGELVDLIGGIRLGSKEHRAKDVLGKVYEYFLGRFASSEGKGGGEFYTPQAVVKLLVEDDRTLSRSSLRSLLWIWRYVCSVGKVCRSTWGSKEISPSMDRRAILRLGVSAR